MCLTFKYFCVYIAGTSETVFDRRSEGFELLLALKELASEEEVSGWYCGPAGPGVMEDRDD